MYEDMELDELVELAQETGGEEGDAMKAELARRYREGDGVARDEEEAEYWEDQMEGPVETVLGVIEEVIVPPAGSTVTAETIVPEDPAATPQPTVSPLADLTRKHPDEFYESLPESELYALYRAGDDPYATYCFASHMMKDTGDKEMGYHDMVKLSNDLDGLYASGKMDKDALALLVKTKLSCGEYLEENGGLERARVYYEQVIELGERKGAAGVLRCYEKSGTLKQRTDEALSMLRRLEDGDAADKLTAADIYSKLDYITPAAINYEAVAKDHAAAPSLRADAMTYLYYLGRRTLKDLLDDSANGDEAATFAAASQCLAAEDFDNAEKLFRLCGTNEPALVDRARAKLADIRLRREQAETVRQLTAEQERVFAEQREKAQAEAAKRERRENGKLRQAANWGHDMLQHHFIISVIAIILIPSVIIAAFRGISTGISNAVTNVTLEAVDPFEDIDLHYSGVAPYATVEVLNNSGDAFLQTATYAVEPSTNLKNGDTITVTVNYDRAKAKEAGYKIEEREKKYTVSGVNSYVTDVSQIDEECLAAMEQQARDMVEATITNINNGKLYETLLGENHYGYGTTKDVDLNNMAQETTYFLNLKSGNSPNDSDANRYIVTYSVPTKLRNYSHVGSNDPFDGSCYYSVVFSNLTYNEKDGATANLSQAWISDPYPSLDNVYTNRVSRFKDKYIVTEIEP